MSKINFDASKVTPQAALDPIPSGWYLAAIVSTNIAATKSDPKGGRRLEVEWVILDGEYKGRKVFDGINIENKNPVAQEIGQQQLSALCHATQTYKLTDTVQLHDKPHRLKVGLERARVDEKTGEEYEARNKYKGCEPAEGAAGASSVGTPAWAGKPNTPATPTPPPAPAEEAPAPVSFQLKNSDVAGPFWLVEDDDSVEKTADEVLEMLALGMPLDTPCMLTSEENWSTVEAYFEPAAQKKKSPPPVARKSNVPATPATPATPAAGKNTPPWMKGKK